MPTVSYQEGQRLQLAYKAAQEVGLPPSYGKRLEGDTWEELLADAHRLAKQLGHEVKPTAREVRERYAKQSQKSAGRELTAEEERAGKK